MWRISAFADEISTDPEEQCALLEKLDITHLVLRSAWDTNVVDLDDDALTELERVLSRHSISVSCIGSPIGKVYLDDDWDEHLTKLDRALEVAQRLQSPFVRIFSFFLRPNDIREQCRDEVVARLSRMADTAERAGATLLHENEKDIYGDSPTHCRQLLELVGSQHLRATFDPANFVQVGYEPLTHGYPMLRPYIADVQIKDATAGTGVVVPAGEGDGQIEQTLKTLQDDGYDGFLVLEPHLGAGHRFGGFSGPELFTQAQAALTHLLVRLDVEYA